jgi:eukaryotic-like serine/threonine-protein kinase
MTPERWRQVEEIFQAAVERDDAERGDYLAEACGDDADLRREVESLLAYETTNPFQQAIKGAARSLVVEQSNPEEPGNNLTGRRIGAYRVTSLIGRGGMGAVYLAERDAAQFDQQVAIKIIKRGMDTDFIRDRFLRERQILAGLDHPHIAHLLDGGTTEDGLPYFVMEQVDGVAITDYCEANKLSITERLKLFRQVCAAVQHAHKKLVVHCDLKPSNILVNRDGAPKLLDFGVAKLLAPDAGQTQTATEQRMLTPDYASPEQVRGLQITTAADIYSLGVVLYELLTNRRPHDLKTASPAEIERAICETEPAKPSDAVSLETASAGKLQKQLAGDLDNIVLMAMRKEPERRYQSVEQFSEDIRRHLEGLPVSARADTFTYRAGKFVRRHRLGVAVAALVTLSLFSGIVVTTRAARIARAERERAEYRFAQVRKLSNTFLFDFHDEIMHLPGSTKAREKVLKTALEYLDSLSREAEEDADLQIELADAYLRLGQAQGVRFTASLGQTDAALESFRKSMAHAQKAAASRPNDPRPLKALVAAYTYVGVSQSGNGDLASGLETFREGARVAEQLERTPGIGQSEMVSVISLFEEKGEAELDARDIEALLLSYRKALQIDERMNAQFPNARSRHSLSLTYARYGDALAEHGDLQATMENYRKATSIREELVRQHPDNALYLRELALLYDWIGHYSGSPFKLNLGDRDAAEQYYRKCLTIASELAAADPENAVAQMDLSFSYEHLADALADSSLGQAAGLYRRALAITRAMLEISPREFGYRRRQAAQLRLLATPLRNLGDRRGAAYHMRQAAEQLRLLLSDYPKHAGLQLDRHWMSLAVGDFSQENGQLEEALTNYTAALAQARQTAADRPNDLQWRWRLADSYSCLGQYHTSLASHPRVSSANRLARLREARGWLSQALEVWDGWRERGVSSIFNTTRREHAARALAQCDAAISRLAAAQKR